MKTAIESTTLPNPKIKTVPKTRVSQPKTILMTI